MPDKFLKNQSKSQTGRNKKSERYTWRTTAVDWSKLDCFVPSLRFLKILSDPCAHSLRPQFPSLPNQFCSDS